MFATSFEAEESAFKTRKTAIALSVTLGVFAIFMAILLLIIFTTPNPPVEEDTAGMAVNFGFDETGMGEEQAFSYNPGPMESNAASTPTTPAAAQPEDVLSSETGDPEVVVPKTETKPKIKTDPNAEFKPNKNPKNNPNTKPAATQAENPNPGPTSDPNALFTKGAYGKPNNSKGDGTGNTPGDQGNPNGDPNAKNYLGEPGNGNTPGPGGNGWSLKGRKKVAIPEPGKCNTAGKVVINIKVNREGKVVEAKYNRFASTSDVKCNIDNALSAAYRAVFNADPAANEFQEGTITYNNVLR